MAPKKLTEYERRRLENIKRNEEMLASLKIQSKANDLSAATKRQSSQKKPKSDTPVVIRKSLRNRGISPDASTAGGLKDDFSETLSKKPQSKQSPVVPGPISMRDAHSGDESDQKLRESILSASKKPHSSYCDGSVGGIDGYPIRVWGSIDLGELRLEPRNVARIVPERIMEVRFFPTVDMNMIVVGNKWGNVGFWDVDAKEEDGDGIYLYRPHSGPVSGIAVQPFSMSKVYTSSYDGFIRLMDVEKEVFDPIYSTDYAIFSISQRPADVKSLYFSEGEGFLNIWDERAGKSSISWMLHEDRINTIDFCSENTDIMATSSTDGTACIWDLRSIDADKPKSLKTVSHKRAVHSAYFSPSGSSLATTSVDDTVGLLTGANFEDTSMIHHNNQTGRWISSFRAIWGWDDSYLFIGHMKRGIDVISTSTRRNFATLLSPVISAIPCLDAHRYKIGMLAGATSGGQVYMWTTS
ncbi:similar to DROUGHT SENSITIVE 1 [Actinidia rufa]|uniref:WD repeat-containing protein 76 n=1 Tax=Actinidia rufa TaxID=165716 RepID=A0A7J0DST0_9ERIC|nr:similar to DROUGHT SENSITIVE 1 [Actinidia rufa]